MPILIFVMCAAIIWFCMSMERRTGNPFAGLLVAVGGVSGLGIAAAFLALIPLVLGMLAILGPLLIVGALIYTANHPTKPRDQRLR